MTEVQPVNPTEAPKKDKESYSNDTTIHLIFDNLTYNEQFKDFFKQAKFTPEKGKEYQTISIIGCQSSGKSTLLNFLFDTKFEVMEENHRGQTTQGIWAAINHEFKTIIFDVEGTDASERGDDRFRYEQCSTLFSLVLSDVLMINMWESDIGRYTAANYGVLKIVFEMNLRLYLQKSEKKIIIVIRDFSEDSNLSDIKESITNDLRNIWKEIKRPEALKDSTPEQFFKFEFFTIAHKNYQTEKFFKDIDYIRGRLKKSGWNDSPEELEDDLKDDKYKKEYIFSHVKTELNVPIDGFYAYSKNLWNDIIENKDLNIPNQKEMLARFRCNELKDESMKLIEDDCNNLISESGSKNIENFKEKVQAIEKKALQNYDDVAKDYLPTIYQSVRNNLQSEISQKLYAAFGNQIKRLIPKYQKNFRIEFEKSLMVSDDFIQIAKTLKEKYLNKLAEEVKVLKVYDSWVIGKDNESLFDEVIENQKELSLISKRAELLRKIKDLVDDFISENLESINETFWKDTNNNIIENFHMTAFPYLELLKDNYDIKNEEDLKKFLIATEDDFYEELKSDFFKRKANIVGNAVESFRAAFWYEEGVPRAWNKLKGKDIEKLYQENKEKYIKIFDMFTNFFVVKHPLELINYTNIKEYEELTNEITNKLKDIFTEKNEINKENIKDVNAEFPVLLMNDEVATLKLKFCDQINDIYEDANRRHMSIKQATIPLWAWVLLIYVSYKDVWNIITGKGIILVVIVVGLIIGLNAMGMGNVPKMGLNFIKNKLGGSIESLTQKGDGATKTE